MTAEQQEFPLTFELAGPATTLGVRHGLDLLFQVLGIIYLGGKLIDRLYQVFYSIGKDQEASKWRKHQDSRTARA